MEFGSAFPSHGEAFELVEQGEGLFDDVAVTAIFQPSPSVPGRPSGNQPR